MKKTIVVVPGANQMELNELKELLESDEKLILIGKEAKVFYDIDGELFEVVTSIKGDDRK